MTLDLHLNQTTFQPGEKITGEVSWNLPANPKTIELRLVWLRAGLGTSEACNADALTIPCGANSGRGAFHFVAPHSPYSYAGSLFQIDWIIEATTRPLTTTAIANLIISPTAAAVEFP